MRKRMSTLSLAFVLLNGAASARAGDKANDLAIQSAVEQKLADKDISNGNGPWVVVENGTATLRGMVKSVWAKNEATKQALSVKNVQAVVDELQIAFGESDKKVAEEVAKKVWSYPYYSVYDGVGVEVDQGKVTLNGRVTMPYKSEQIEKRASKVLGVQSVTNQIATLPVNIGDERLRTVLFRRIYGDSLFMEFAHQFDPPVHIIVDRGRVTLAGVVRSKVEQMKAASIARSTFGVFSVENQLRVGD